jgi:hypothetical protein
VLSSSPKQLVVMIPSFEEYETTRPPASSSEKAIDIHPKLMIAVHDGKMLQTTIKRLKIR